MIYVSRPPLERTQAEGPIVDQLTFSNLFDIVVPNGELCLNANKLSSNKDLATNNTHSLTESSGYGLTRALTFMDFVSLREEIESGVQKGDDLYHVAREYFSNYWFMD